MDALKEERFLQALSGLKGSIERRNTSWQIREIYAKCSFGWRFKHCKI